MPEHAKEPLINSSGYGKLLRRVVVHLDIPGRQACKACGYLEPIDVFRFEDEDGEQYGVGTDLPRCPDRGTVVGSWNKPNGWNHPAFRKSSNG